MEDNLSLNSSTSSNLILVRVGVPELNVEKCLQFHKDEIIWEVKQQALSALPKVRKRNAWMVFFNFLHSESENLKNTRPKKLFDNMKQFHCRHSETIRNNTQEFLETFAKRKYNLIFFSCLLWIWILPPLATNHRNTNPIRNSLRSLSTRENRYVLKTIGLNFPRQCFDLQRSMLHSTYIPAHSFWS